MDPVKASETPVPRGTFSTKKRPGEDGSPTQIKKQKRDSDPGQPYSPIQPIHQAPMQGHGVLKPLLVPNGNGPSHRPNMSTSNGEHQQQAALPSQQPQQQPPIDPNLFTMYSEPDQSTRYGDSRYQYSNGEQTQPYHQPQSMYQIPSLEQIANEVLVDMNGNEPQDQGFRFQHPTVNEGFHPVDGADTASMPNGTTKMSTSVDSAVSLPNAGVPGQTNATSHRLSGAEPLDIPANGLSAEDMAVLNHLPHAHPSIETKHARTDGNTTSSHTAPSTSPNSTKVDVSSLPLYQPPAPPSRSPDALRRQPPTPNGIGSAKNVSPVEATPLKRKRDSTSTTPGASSAKKVKADGVDRRKSGESSEAGGEQDRQSMELAKILQQQELGLRRRSK